MAEVIGFVKALPEKIKSWKGSPYLTVADIPPRGIIPVLPEPT
jgi:hypothetical protein